MNDDLKLLCDAVKEMLKDSNDNFKTDLKITIHHHQYLIPFILPDKKLAIDVDNDKDLDPKEFQVAIQNQTKARWCEHHHLKYIVYDGYNDKMIKTNLKM